MMDAFFRKHTLQFKFNAGTSRGVLKTKDTWFIKVWDNNKPDVYGIGECGPLKGLSVDDRPDFEEKLHQVCRQISNLSYENFLECDCSSVLDLKDFPSIIFALETAFMDLYNGGHRKLFNTSFSQGISGITINGLVWMGDKQFMEEQINDKIKAGFSCIKLKVGAIDFDKECSILYDLRKKYSAEKITLRVDANGAFSVGEALDKLKALSKFHLHSIEQPIKQGQVEEMKTLCAISPVPVALDEELIGLNSLDEKRNLLKAICPPYIIIKPTLLGGLKSSREWITLAEEMNIGWWITSALESNIGLNAIAQFTSTFSQVTSIPQGLGTGQLYHNNIESPLVIQKGSLYYDPSKNWDSKFYD